MVESLPLSRYYYELQRAARLDEACIKLLIDTSPKRVLLAVETERYKGIPAYDDTRVSEFKLSCPVCRRRFAPNSANHKYCSSACSQRAFYVKRHPEARVYYRRYAESVHTPRDIILRNVYRMFDIDEKYA